MNKVAEMPWVCDFDDLDRHTLPWVGGKGANLGEMVQQGFPVPPGFCVTTRAYRIFVESGGDRLIALFEQLGQLGAQQLPEIRKVALALREAMQAHPIPQEVEDAILVAWKEHGAQHSYAVRSSATAEDLPGASFAGQQDTYLNVQGEEMLLDRVRACWASLFTDRAIVYRLQNGFKHEEVALSVVVQKMVLPQVSGIMFTADPLHQNRRVISIDAGFGLGEALVSGKVSADLYNVRKDTMTILKKDIADKRLAIWPVEGGGTVEEPLDEERRHAQVLGDKEILALAALGQRIEEHYKSPQDIEWCIDDGELFVVQSRPITSLYPMIAPLPDDDTLHVYMSFNHAQVMLDPFRPLGASALSLMMPFGKEGAITPDCPFLRRAGGRLYIDLTEVLRNALPYKVYPVLLANANAHIAEAVKEVIQRPRFREEMKTAPHFSFYRTARRLLFPLMRKAFVNIFFANPKGKLQQLKQYIDDETERVRKDIHSVPAGLQRFDRTVEHVGSCFLQRILNIFLPVVAAGLVSVKMLAQLAGTTVNDPLINELMRGLEHNVTTEMDLRVADLAEVARAHPAVMSALREDPTKRVLETLSALEGGEVFLAALQAFMDEYGMRGPSEIDVTRARWVEEPTPLLQMLAGNLTREGNSGHRAHHAKLTKVGEEAGKKVVDAVRKRPFGWFKAPLAKRLVKSVRGFTGGREHPKFLMIRYLGLFKEVVKEEAQTLVEQGRIGQVEDIYFLEIEEIRRLLSGEETSAEGTSWTALITARREVHQHFMTLSPPGVLTSEGEVVVAQMKRDDIPKGALGGSPASAGVIEGIARVIMDPSDAVLQDGEILVAPFTDPGWTPLFIHASGLVMEVGGLMTHGSVVAREYGIPAVVGVLEATSQIKSGQRIRLNGDSGYVELLSDDTQEVQV
tara:strand:+ start:12850 stop:15582 length:2733 start_codon:yes stop_codon:yes gene_type:complete